MKVFFCLALWVSWSTESGIAQVTELQEFPSASSWSYQYQQFWGNINNAHCAKPKSQSPIDIPKNVSFVKVNTLTKTSQGEQLGPATWIVGAPSLNVTLTPGPLTWDVKVLQSNGLITEYDGQRYALVSVTFKSPSEHTVEGGHNAMEIELHHEAKDWYGKTEYLIISVSMAAKDQALDNTFLEEIWSQFPASAQATVAPVFEIENPYVALFPEDKSFVTYPGSETTPLCNPARWVVFLQPGIISMRQLNLFRASISGYTPTRLIPGSSAVPAGIKPSHWDSRYGTNNRLIQLLGGRQLTLHRMVNVPNKEGFSTVGQGVASPPSDLWLNLLMLLLVLALVCGLAGVGWWIRSHHHHDGGCCATTDDDEEGHELQKGIMEGREVAHLSPFPEQYMGHAAPRAGFGNHDQIYLG